mmetsp:Transcript_8187/g.22703  ORF Transcript_8187/g.22703 Transcript_8187/m.22703 type:complete len:102 (-) Transcript_8187:59-364(-)
MLLDVDGLEDGWQSQPAEFQLFWAGEWGDHDPTDLPFAIRRLYEAEDNFRHHDSSGMGAGNDEEEEEEAAAMDLLLHTGGKTHQDCLTLIAFADVWLDILI